MSIFKRIKNRRVNYFDVVLSRLERHWLIELVALICISIFEGVFIVRCFLNGRNPFKDAIHTGYFASYAALLVASLICITVVALAHKNKISKKLFFVCCHAYAVIIGVWSLAISIVDIYQGNYPIVFVTVMFSLPFFVVLSPWIIWSISTVGTVALIWVQYWAHPDATSGFWMNLVVFTLMSCLIAWHSYDNLRKTYILEAELTNASQRDGLTHLLNRRMLDKRLESIVENKESISIIMIDFDDFKTINDTYGHKFGDDCLVALSEGMLNEFGDDCSYRYGGDEFCAVSTSFTSEIVAKMERINAMVKAKTGNEEIHVSAGIYSVSDNVGVKDILVAVDDALYEAKKNKVGHSVLYSEIN